MTQWGLDTIFNPAKRHMDEEKRRLQSTREEVGDNSGGKRIDLETGKVRIHAESESADADATPEANAGGKPSTGNGRRRGSAAEPTAAQIRAAARRGRKLD